VNRIKKLLSLLLVIVVVTQPLHSFTTIGIKSSDDDNGFQYLHSELCGSKYTNSVSHIEQFTNFLDKVNSIILSDINSELLCCESLDTVSYEHNDILQYSFKFPFIQSPLSKCLYYFNYSTSVAFSNLVRAPPYT